MYFYLTNYIFSQFSIPIILFSRDQYKYLHLLQLHFNKRIKLIKSYNFSSIVRQFYSFSQQLYFLSIFSLPDYKPSLYIPLMTVNCQSLLSLTVKLFLLEGQSCLYLFFFFFQAATSKVAAGIVQNQTTTNWKKILETYYNTCW